MSRLRIVHHTGYRYEKEATASYNEARMLPWRGGGQYVLTSDLIIEPGAHQSSYIDYWGTKVGTFEVLHPHHELSVTATSLVEVGPALNDAVRASWEEVAHARTSASMFVELLMATQRTTAPDELAEKARAIAAAAADPYEAAAEICAFVRERIAYVSGVTAVTSTATDAWAVGKGVCQDIAHVALAALRAVGIPARYVSGYLHPRPDAVIGETVTGESHAWVEWYTGSWTGFDPTNGIPIGERHVLVGRGRDYRDVSPLRGVYAGSGASDHFVSVEITREG